MASGEGIAAMTGAGTSGVGVTMAAVEGAPEPAAHVPVHKTPSGWRMYALIAAMGFLGAVLRYVLELVFSGAAFPFGTLLINVVGCFFLVVVNGFVGRRLHVHAATVRAMGVGLLGAFTTLSAFTQETLTFFLEGRYGIAALYVALTFVLCFAAALAGVATDDTLACRRLAMFRRRHAQHHEHYGETHGEVPR